MSILLENGRQTARAVRTFGRAQIAISEGVRVSDVDDTLARFSSGLFHDASKIVARSPLSSLVASNADEIRAIVESYGLDEVYVFGSVAEGRDGSGSDIDFIVTGDYRTFNESLVSLSTDLEELLGVSVDVVHPSSFSDFATFIAYSEVTSV